MMFEGYDFSDFWENAPVSGGGFEVNPPDEALIKEIEGKLGYKLPASYIALMKQRNGGYVKKCSFPWSEDPDDCFYISSIMGIGYEKYSLCGQFGSQFWIDEWEYPPIGVAVCDTPSAGHEMVFLDYRACGPQGEPSVVCVNQEADYAIVPLAENFESFIMNLR